MPGQTSSNRQHLCAFPDMLKLILVIVAKIEDHNGNNLLNLHPPRMKRLSKS